MNDNEKCDCDRCVRCRRQNILCRLGLHKFEKGKYTWEHMTSKWCLRCEQRV